MKVRVNGLYYFDPGFMDITDNYVMSRFKRGDHVRVVNQRNCPPANTMGNCYIVPADAKKDARGNYDKDFAMVQTASLVKAWSNSPA